MFPSKHLQTLKMFAGELLFAPRDWNMEGEHFTTWTIFRNLIKKKLIKLFIKFINLIIKIII